MQCTPDCVFPCFRYFLINEFNIFDNLLMSDFFDNLLNDLIGALAEPE